VLVDQLTLEEEAYFQQFDAAWKRYFNQSPDVWLKFLMPGDNTASSLLTPWPVLNFSCLGGQ